MGTIQRAQAEASLLVTRLGLEPVVLGEKTSERRTIIEKFEAHSNVGFAVVLMTGDDRGGSVGQPHEEQQRRARQNVIWNSATLSRSWGEDALMALVYE